MTPASRSPTPSMATSSVSGSPRNAAGTPKAPLTPIANTDSRTLPGWTWDPIADQWEEGFSRLQDYVKGHGDARVPRSYKVDGYRLGSWINSQRTDHAKGTLDTDRQRRLEDLPGWTWDALRRPVGGGFQPTTGLRQTPR